MAFFPSPSTYPSMLGELFSAAFSAPAFNWQCSPAATELETIVLDWLAQMLHLPEAFLSKGEGGGVIHGSASEACATAIVAARERYLGRASEGLVGEEAQQRRTEVRGRLVVLGSDQNHSSIAKGALIAGAQYKGIATSLGDAFALTGHALSQALDECSREGLDPFFLTVNLGTTNTCAVDCLDEIRSVTASRPEIWVHVDAAYAGAALCCDEYAHLAAAIRTFDSFNVNLAKWLLTNFDAR